MSWVGDVQTGTGTPKTTVQFLQTRQPEADICSEIVRRQAMDVALHRLCMLLEAPRYSWRPIRGVHGFPKPYAHLHGGVGPPMGAVTCHRHGERQSSPPPPDQHRGGSAAASNGRSRRRKVAQPSTIRRRQCHNTPGNRSTSAVDDWNRVPGSAYRNSPVCTAHMQTDEDAGKHFWGGST